jgi:D-beta-D-heptose 7-phosphate kinase/D-beta-D-heptose 1-phosphate adenosyltransferase
MKKKITSLKSLIEIRASLKKKKKKVVFTNGCFDILHRGHVTYLAKARSFGDVLILGLNKDASIKRIKGEGRPINNEKDRAIVVSALECVDYVVLFGEDTPLRLITALKPDILVKGSDWAIDKIVGKDVLDTYGGKVKRVSLVAGRSTTNVIDKIQKNNDVQNER